MENPRPGAADRAAFAVLLFLGVTAVGGGSWMLAVPHGDRYLPVDVLEGTPLSTWTIPGLVLGGGFGLGGLVTAWGVLTGRRLIRLSTVGGRPWAWLAALALGIGMLLWVTLQLAMLPDKSFLQALYGAVGIALVALSVRRLREPRRVAGGSP